MTNNSDCRDLCPQYEICEQMRLKGFEAVSSAGTDFVYDSMIEYQTEDGRFVNGEEFFGTPEPNLAAEKLRQAGYQLQNASAGLKDKLLKGCKNGPVRMGARFICSSSVDIGITMADLGLDQDSSVDGAIVNVDINEGNQMEPGQEPSSNEVNNRSTAEFVEERLGWLREAAELYHGPEIEGDIIGLLPEPTEPRADAEGWDLDDAKEAKLREIAGRFGIGGEQDVLAESEIHLLEGGKPWKVASEMAISSGSNTVILAGSPNRKIGDDEHKYMTTKHQTMIENETEYDMVRRIAEGAEGFVPLEEDVILPFGYDIKAGHQLVEEPTGQFVEIGTINGAQVVILRVDRENMLDGKYQNQPGALDLLKVVADARTAAGDQTSTIGFLTSNTYASRAISVVEAGFDSNREFSVGMYGRNTLANVQGNPVAEPTAINQIPSELNVMAKAVIHLQNKIDQR